MKTIPFIIFGSIIFISGCSISPKISNSVSSDKITTSTSTSYPEISAEKTLDLSNKNLTKVDMSIFDNVNLEELNLSYNNLADALPSQIGNLKKLRILKAGSNQLTGVPAEVGQLSNLEVLDLSNNQLTGLPYELANLKKLRTLNLSGNPYSEQDLEVIRNSLPNVEYIK